MDQYSYFKFHTIIFANLEMGFKRKKKFIIENTYSNSYVTTQVRLLGAELWIYIQMSDSRRTEKHLYFLILSH